MIGAPCQSSSSLTRTRTLSSRQIRQRGSLRSKSSHKGSAALVIVLIRKSSIRAASPSDTDMAIPPRSRRARAVVGGFILPESRPVARQGKKQQARVNAKSNPLQNEFQFWRLCGTYLYLETYCCLSNAQGLEA